MKNRDHDAVPSALDGMPDDIRSKLQRSLLAHTKKILEAEGPAAFEMPREAAAIHEAGHAVVGKHDGILIKKVSIFNRTRPIGTTTLTAWGGFTSRRGGAWTVSPSDDLIQARSVIAGLAAESMTKWHRAGSSLDELVASQLIAQMAARKLGVDKEKLWRDDVCGRARMICKHNFEVCDQIAERLHRLGSITGDALKLLLAEVKQLPTTKLGS